MAAQANPFYRNPVFGKADRSLPQLTWRHKLTVCFRPMHVQVNEGYAIHFKVGGDMKIYVFKVEPLTPPPQ